MPHVHSMNELVESDHKALLQSLAELENAFRQPELKNSRNGSWSGSGNSGTS